MRIVRPEKKYLDSYLAGCKETWGHVHDSYILHNPTEYDIWKTNIFEEYNNQEQGKNLPEGFVPSVTYWIIENDEYLGTVNIRPRLNARLEEYGGHAGMLVRLKYRQKGYGYKLGKIITEKSRQIGIRELLLTCEDTNISSKKILEYLNPYKIVHDKVILNGAITRINRYYYGL